MISAFRKIMANPLVSSIHFSTCTPLLDWLILFRDQILAVELTVLNLAGLRCLGLAHISRFSLIGFTAVEGWDPVSIQLDVRAPIFQPFPLFYRSRGLAHQISWNYKSSSKRIDHSVVRCNVLYTHREASSALVLEQLVLRVFDISEWISNLLSKLFLLLLCALHLLHESTFPYPTSIVGGSAFPPSIPMRSRHIVQLSKPK
jgi:hypothetical protein